MANFTPTLAPIHEKSPFRFWCQKVLPTVYDDSLSYYELLTKVVYYLNENTQDLETVNSNVEALYNSYVELQNYVNNYFDQNFPELVEQKLDEMVEDGTFDAMLHAIVDPYFELKSEEIGNTLQNQNEHIQILQNEWNNFVHDHAGLTTETQINSNNVTAEGDIWYFTEDITDFTYIDFHHVLTGGNSINPVITRTKAEDLVSLYANQKLTFVYPPNSTTTDKSLVAYMFELEPIPDTSDPEITRAYKDRLRIAKAIKWEWDGTTNNANVTHAVTGTATDTLCGFLDGAFGIKDVQNDAEVIDARTGYNGTVYQTLGQAIRTQVDDLYTALDRTGLSAQVKTALLNCFANVAWKNENGETYYNALNDALNERTLLSISAVYTQTGTVYDTDSLDSLKNDLVVTAYYDNATTSDVTNDAILSGTLTVGVSTITATYQGMTATFNVNVSARTNLVMPTLTINGTTYLCGIGSDSVPCWGLYLRTASQGRRTLAYDSGTVKYRARQTTGSNADFLNCPEVDYYPIPIPADATTITVTCPSNISLIVGIGQIDSSDTYYHKIYEPTWDTASTTHTVDISSYNDGTYFAHINLNTQLTSVEGFSVTFA